MPESTDKHDCCKYGRYMRDENHNRKFRGCSYGSDVRKLSPKECLNCEHFEKQKDRVDVWLDFFDAYKKRNK